jgi:hypothetical protein
MKVRSSKTLLQSLMSERHLTREHAIEALDRRARDMGVRDFALSLRQLDRWLAGDLATLPRPSLCRVVEMEFGYPVERLLAFSDLVEASTGQEARPMPLDQLVSKAATESARADSLGGFWITSYQFNSEEGIRYHADITRVTPQSSRRLTARNYPPDPRTQGHGPAFRNEIEAQLANRHVIGHWRNISDTRYFGSIHLAVLPGEAVMEGYYTAFSSDVRVDVMRWKWVRLEPLSLSGVELPQVALKEPDEIYALLEHSAYDAPLTLTAVAEGDT